MKALRLVQHIFKYAFGKNIVSDLLAVILCGFGSALFYITLRSN